jgi:hypothetical protein
MKAGRVAEWGGEWKEESEREERWRERKRERGGGERAEINCIVLSQQ